MKYENMSFKFLYYNFIFVSKVLCVCSLGKKVHKMRHILTDQFIFLSYSTSIQCQCLSIHYTFQYFLTILYITFCCFPWFIRVRLALWMLCVIPVFKARLRLNHLEQMCKPWEMFWHMHTHNFLAFTFVAVQHPSTMLHVCFCVFSALKCNLCQHFSGQKKTLPCAGKKTFCLHRYVKGAVFLLHLSSSPQKNVQPSA